MKHENAIYIKGARVHNLRNIEVEIPHDKLVVITGLSGSGKSTLAFDTIFAEGQRRYVESSRPMRASSSARSTNPTWTSSRASRRPSPSSKGQNAQPPFDGGYDDRDIRLPQTVICPHRAHLFARLGRGGALFQRGRRGGVDSRACGPARGDRRPRWRSAEGQGIIEKLTLLLSEGLMRVYMGGEVKLIEDVLPGIGSDTDPQGSKW